MSLFQTMNTANSSREEWTSLPEEEELELEKVEEQPLVASN